MNQRLDNLTANTPRQIAQDGLDTSGNVLQFRDAAARPEISERCFRVVAGTSPCQHPVTPIARAEGFAKADIVTPCLELADRGVALSDETFAFPVIGDRPRTKREAGEAFVDECGHMVIKQRGADAPTLATASCRASVADEPVRVDRAGKDKPAVRAARDASEQPVLVSPGVVAGSVTVVRGLPDSTIYNGRPCVLNPQLARTNEDAERGLRLDDALHCAGRPTRPPAGCRHTITDQVIRDCSPPGTAGAGTEDPAYYRGSVIVNDGQAVAGSAVAEWWATRETPGAGGSLLGSGKMFVRLVALPLSHDQQQSEHCPANGRGGIDALRDADDSSAAFVELLNRCEATNDGSCEPVEPCNDEASADALLDTAESGIHAWPVHRSTGPVEVFMPRPDRHAVSLRPPLNAVSLLPGRLEAFAGASGGLGHADIAVEGEHGTGDCGIVHRTVIWAANGEPSDNAAGPR